MALTGREAIATEWVLLVLAWALVTTRIYVRFVVKQMSLILSDYLLLLGAASSLGLVTCDTLTFKEGALDDLDMWNVRLAKIAFAGNYFYYVGLYWPKLSIVAFYHKLFPPIATSTTMRVMLYSLTVYIIACTIATFCADTFWCAPNIASNWSMEKNECSVFISKQLFQISWALNFTSDIFIFAYPFPLLAKLQVDRRRFIALVLTFALGAITIIVNLTRFAVINTVGMSLAMYIFAMAEVCTALMVVSLPTLHSLIRKPCEKESSYPGSPRISNPISFRSLASFARFNGFRSSSSRNIQEDDFETRSDVELNAIKDETIYKTDEVNVFSDQRRPDSIPGRMGSTTIIWTEVQRNKQST